MRKEMKETFSLTVALLLTLMILNTPILQSRIVAASDDGTQKGPRMDHLQFKFYTGQTALFTALLNNEIDIMSWMLTSSEYTSILGNLTFQLVPCSPPGDYEIAFNNNATDPSHTADRKAMNYTEFRQAIACLVDKDGLIAGPTIAGFGTRIDTQVARPSQNDWVDFNLSKYGPNGELLNNYPWDYNETHALEILWTNGWYNYTTYPTLSSLLTALTPIPQDAAHGCVYPPGHPRQGQLIDPIVAYIRNTHLPRQTAGQNLIAEMNNLGMPNTPILGASSVCYTPVFINHDYDFYTAGWSFGRFPTQFYSLCTPIGIYAGGGNIYMIDDANLTYHAIMEYPNATSSAQSMSEALICQEILVRQACFVPLYESNGYCAYRKGLLGATTTLCEGFEYLLNPMMLNIQHENYPATNTIRYGTLNPPEQINPVFSSWIWEYEVADRIFTGAMEVNPSKEDILGKSPAGGDLPWMAYDWKYEQGPDGNAIVTLWFNQSIKWQDGVPFTVDDVNYTIYLQQAYGDSWGQWDFMQITAFQKIDDWTCKIYFNSPSIYSMYACFSSMGGGYGAYEMVPKHLYEYIDVPSDAGSGSSTTGHHGEWPGKNSLSSEISSNPYFTWSQLTGSDGGRYVWVGTGMWKYQTGTYASGSGGGITLNANRDFFLYTPPVGEVDFNYYWNPGSPPQNGCFMVDLKDWILLYEAMGSTGNLPSSNWDAGCDIASPSCTIDDYDFAALTTSLGVHWGYNGWIPPTTYQLNITTTSGGTTSPAPGNYTFGSGFGLVVNATSDAGYMLVHWELDGIDVGSDNPYIVVMDQSHVLKPIFARSVVLYTAPQEVQVTHGTSFSVDVNVQNVTDLYAFDVYVHFDPNLLQAINMTEGSFLKSGGNTGVVLSEVNQTAGYLEYVVTLWTAETGVNGSGTLFTATLVGDLVNNGTSTLSFESSELSDSNANLISYVSQEGTVNVTALTLVTQTVTVNQTEYTVELTSNSTIPSGSQFLVDVSNQTVSVNVTGMSGSMGFCNLTLPKAVMNGTFAVLINGTAVAYMKTENATHYMLYFTYAQSFEQVQVLLTIQGDINGDRKVALADLVLLANAYNSVPGSPKWDGRCDLNRDNRISLQDLVLLAKNYGKTYTPP